jgi:hypothetical protein
MWMEVASCERIGEYRKGKEERGEAHLQSRISYELQGLIIDSAGAQRGGQRLRKLLDGDGRKAKGVESLFGLKLTDEEEFEGRKEGEYLPVLERKLRHLNH